MSRSNPFNPSLLAPDESWEQGIVDSQNHMMEDPFIDHYIAYTDPLGISYSNVHQHGLVDSTATHADFAMHFNEEPMLPMDFSNQTDTHNSVHAQSPVVTYTQNVPQTPRTTLITSCHPSVEHADHHEEHLWSPSSFISDLSLPSAQQSQRSSSSFPSFQHSRSNSLSVPSFSDSLTLQYSTPDSRRRRSSTETPCPSSSMLSAPPSSTQLSEKRRSAPTTRLYTPIAPHPDSTYQLAGTRRSLEDDEVTDWPSLKKQRSMTPLASPQVEISEDDRLLLKLKNEDHLSWKEIVAKFASERGQEHHASALQMRIKRLRDKLRPWNDSETQALRLTHQYWERNKFEIIAAKMADFGSTEKWTAKQCRQKWLEICGSNDLPSSMMSM